MNIKKLINLYLTDFTAFNSYVESIDKAISGVTVAQHVNQNEEIRLLQPKYIQQLENQFRSLLKFQDFNITAMDILRENFYDPCKCPVSGDAESRRKGQIYNYFMNIEDEGFYDDWNGEGVTPLQDALEGMSPQYFQYVAEALVEIYDAAGFAGTVQGDRKHAKLEQEVRLCAENGAFMKKVRKLANEKRRAAAISVIGISGPHIPSAPL